MFNTIVKWTSLGLSVIGAGTGSVALVKSYKNKKRLNQTDAYQVQLENDIVSALEAVNELSAPAPVVAQDVTTPVLTVDEIVSVVSPIINQMIDDRMKDIPSMEQLVEATVVSVLSIAAENVVKTLVPPTPVVQQAPVEVTKTETTVVETVEEVEVPAAVAETTTPVEVGEITEEPEAEVKPVSDTEVPKKTYPAKKNASKNKKQTS